MSLATLLLNAVKEGAERAPAIIERKIAETGFDPRFDKRILEQERLKNLTTKVKDTQGFVPPKLSLADFEGRPFITSMSDRTGAGGQIMAINGQNLNKPVELMGGQDHMFNNPGQVWASAKAPVKQIMSLAKGLKEATGQNPLYIPWRMAPSGGDFSHMTGETMLNYLDSSLGKGDRRTADRQIKKFIPSWNGLASEDAVNQYMSIPLEKRKLLHNMLDVNYRNDGGLSLGEARLAVTDPKQLTSPDLGIMNIGEIFADQPVIKNSGHLSYEQGVPGQGLGTHDEMSVLKMLPDFVKKRQEINQPDKDFRALMMKPYSGVLTGELLKAMGY